MHIQGQYADGRSSRLTPCVLTVTPEGRLLLSVSGNGLPVSLAEVHISERIGNIPRSLRFPDGGRFETTDNAAIDRLLKQHGLQRVSQWTFRLESGLRYVLVATLVVAIGAFSFYRWGIPALARSAAFAMSPSTVASIGQGTLEAMDKLVFRPSALPQETQTRLRARFDSMAGEQADGFEYQLLFRSGEGLGPNAFALPSGTIVMTDAMVELADNDEELVSVLAHEFGHVVQRHGVRQLIQSSVVAMLVVLITGDASNTAELIAALPALLIEAEYSRKFEREADRFALEYMSAHAIPLVHFSNLMQRLGKVYGEGDKDSVIGFLSSHPPTPERLRMVEQFRAQRK